MRSVLRRPTLVFHDLSVEEQAKGPSPSVTNPWVWSQAWPRPLALGPLASMALDTICEIPETESLHLHMRTLGFDSRVVVRVTGDDTWMRI